MDITIDKTSDCQATLTAIASPAEVTAIKDAAINAFSKNVRIPGFRPGKAPKSVVAKRYAEGIADELEARIKADAQDLALEQNPDLKVLDFGEPTTTAEEDGSYKLVNCRDLAEKENLDPSVIWTDLWNAYEFTRLAKDKLAEIKDKHRRKK